MASGQWRFDASRRPEFVVAAVAALLQWVTLAPLRGPFVYADELGYVAAARYFGPGYPEVRLQAGFLHAGYGLLLSPLTAIFQEPSGFHRAATILNGVLLVGASVVSCRVLTRLYFLDRTQSVIVGLLFASSTAVLVNSGILWTESLLLLMVVALASLGSVPVLSTWRIAALAMLAAAFYAVHPRTIVLSVGVAVALLAEGRRQRRLGRALLAVGVITLGVIGVRWMHGITADRLFADNAIELGNNSSVERRIRSVADRPTNWIGGLIGTAWYQLAASFGLAAVAVGHWCSGASHWLGLGPAAAEDNGFGQPRGGHGAARLGMILGLAALLGWGTAATITGGELVRVDQTVYGRYLDHLGPFALATGAAVLLSSPEAKARRTWLVGALAVPPVGGLISVWWGSEMFDGSAPFGPVNAPFFAALVDLVGSRLPLLVGLVVGVFGAAAWLFSRRWPTGTFAILVVGLAFIGIRASFDHVRVQSQDSVNLRGMADAIEASGADRVLLAEPFAFLNLYSDQFWADDVQFHLGSECPVRQSDLVIAPIDDPRYLDHRVVFTDPRTERQLLEPPAVVPPDPSMASVQINGVPETVESGSTVDVRVAISNNGTQPLPIRSGGIRVLSVAYRFIGEGQSRFDTRPVVVDVGSVTIAPGEVVSVDVELAIRREGEPLSPGRHLLVADLFVDGLGWANEAGCPDGLPSGQVVEVVGAAG